MADRLGHFSMGRLKDTPHRRSRDPHPFSDLLLAEALEVGEAKRLGLIETEDYLLEIAKWDASRLEVDRLGKMADCTSFWRSGHLSFLAYARKSGQR